MAVEELHVAGEQLATQSDALIAQRDLLERDRRYYSSLFRTMPAPSLVTDDAGRIVEVNDQAARLLGADGRFLIGKPFAVFVAEESQKTFSASFIRSSARRASPDVTTSSSARGA